MALYSRGNYDDAVKSLLQGADLNPSDPDCYLFLSKAYNSSPSQADEVIERFRRFAELQPRNARASYYYAMSLWKGKRAQDPGLDLQQIEALLKTAIALDPKLAEAHLQLGNLYSDQNKYAEAIPEYERARELDPDLADVHYRLGQAYVRTGAERPRSAGVCGLSATPGGAPGGTRQTAGGNSTVRVFGEGWRDQPSRRRSAAVSATVDVRHMKPVLSMTQFSRRPCGSGLAAAASTPRELAGSLPAIAANSCGLPPGWRWAARCWVRAGGSGRDCSQEERKWWSSLSAAARATRKRLRPKGRRIFRT